MMTDVKCLLIVHSYHHRNTEKVARRMAEILEADLITLDQFASKSLKDYDLIGFGGGIDSGKHYQPLLDFVSQLPEGQQQKAFIFSTSAIYSVSKVAKDHKAMRELLNDKHFNIIGEFSCKGHNTNAFLKYFGGMNKGRPNQEDLQEAQGFAEDMLQILLQG